MYQYPTRYHRPTRRGSYFLPFVSLIILGLIVVLIFQIVSYFKDKRQQALENKASIKIVTGRAEMKIWGVDQWTSAIDESILSEGDALRTIPGSRVVLTLLNGSVVRLNSETEVELTALRTRDSQDEATFTLKKGEVWLKRSENDTVRASFEVLTPHLEVRSTGTIFDVLNTTDEAVRVIDGKISVAVKVEEQDGDRTKTRIAETHEVGVGQEVVLGPEEVSALQNRQPVDLLFAYADDFRTSDWYAWNRKEDVSGTSTVSVADAVKQSDGATVSTVLPLIADDDTPSEVTSLTTPKILTPKESERTVKTSSVTISGETSAATEKIEVTTYTTGKAEPYVLTKYKAGTAQWSYVASTTFGNFVPGTNRFTIRAIGKDGTKSDPAELTIFYDKPKEPADLSAPKVVSFNDKSSSETTEDSVKVEGTVGKGIAKVFINEFQLTRFIYDSTTWVYYAKTSYGNLKEGANTYEVYGVDAEGNKTPITKFTITKLPKSPAETAAPETETDSSSSPPAAPPAPTPSPPPASAPSTVSPPTL